MRSHLYILLLLLFPANAELPAQSGSFNVTRASFSTWNNDEFSPVYWGNGIVFCSNIRDNSLAGYSDGKKRLYKIYYVEEKNSSGWKLPRLLSKELTSGLNDGPATFSSGGNIIYFSRNNSATNPFRSVSDTSNRLGIYWAELVNATWSDIKPFLYNDPRFSYGTPSLDPGGNRIYFSSDRPGGYGGMDLYYCQKQGDAWENPVNLGPAVNTKKNESFPFAASHGKLYFASDGHKGFGGKDLYYTQEINGIWIPPVHLDSAINSPYDDFGLIADSTFKKGFFSSNRLKSDDIFSFNAAPVEFTNCDSILENRYCFTFYDEHHHNIDTIQTSYIWDFGNGIKKTGNEVRYCFPGPGEYIVRLTIIDELTGDTITNQARHDVKLHNIEQAVIISADTGLAGKSLTFEGVTADLKGIKITDYYWDFGDGFNTGGAVMNRTFKKRGDYLVKMGLLAEKDSLNVIRKICVMKKIRIN
jgi:hypothetical protein